MLSIVGRGVWSCLLHLTPPPPSPFWHPPLLKFCSFPNKTLRQFQPLVKKRLLPHYQHCSNPPHFWIGIIISEGKKHNWIKIYISSSLANSFELRTQDCKKIGYPNPSPFFQPSCFKENLTSPLFANFWRLHASLNKGVWERGVFQLWSYYLFSSWYKKNYHLIWIRTHGHLLWKRKKNQNKVVS